MTWSKFLKYSQGIIFLETAEYDKVSPPPFADQMGVMKYQQSIQQRLFGIWDAMFPRTKKYYDELEEGARRFKKHMELWRRKDNASKN